MNNLIGTKSKTLLSEIEDILKPIDLRDYVDIQGNATVVLKNQKIKSFIIQEIKKI